ncbi:hypothetical protein ACWEJ6_54435 [Nonomuraea sp. NPDC004702]
MLFETAYVCGARASEVRGLYVEDLDLRLDDEHVRIHGKGGSVRTVPLHDLATSPCSSSTWPAPATTPGRCFDPASTAAADRRPTTPPTTAGRPTAPSHAARSTSGQRALCRTARRAHRQTRPRRAGLHPADPGHRPVTPDHPATHRPPTPSPGPPRHRSTRAPLKNHSRANNGTSRTTRSSPRLIREDRAGVCRCRRPVRWRRT